VEFEIGRSRDDDVLVTKSGRKRERSLLAPDARQVLQWIRTRKKPFRGHQAVQALDAVATARIGEILEEFAEIGLILRRQP
jgi:50S ribosomal protein L16 3-hydroxylase